MAVEKPIAETEVVKTTSDEKSAEEVIESAVEENVPVEVAIEEVTEPAEAVTKVAEKPMEKNSTSTEGTVEETAKKNPTPAEESTPTTTLDITIGSAVIHVNDKTSPELLSRTVQSLVSAMQTK